jgi:hypothetical protein
MIHNTLKIQRNLTADSDGQTVPSRSAPVA